MDRRYDGNTRAEFEEVRRQIEARVRRVCNQWPDGEIVLLTSRMARIYLKYRLLTSMPRDN